METTNLLGGMQRVYGRSSLVVQKYSPEILLGVGVIGMVASTVLACKATLKAEDLLKETKEKFQSIEIVKNSTDIEHYSDEDHRKDLAIAGLQTVTSWGKLYGPAVALGAASLTAIIGSHGIMSRRATSLMAAYGLLQEGFGSYGKHVVDELGVEKDREFRFGIQEEKVSEDVMVDGKKKKKKGTKKSFDPNAKSDYARFFDEYSVNWRNEPTMNLHFLKTQQNYANDILKSRGHIFLNEVYDNLGLPRTKAGAVVGWLRDSEGDGFVDFGIYDVDAASFVNGYESSVLLDFNVDGVIYDLI